MLRPYSALRRLRHGQNFFTRGRLVVDIFRVLLDFPHQLIITVFPYTPATGAANRFRHGVTSSVFGAYNKGQLLQHLWRFFGK